MSDRDSELIPPDHPDFEGAAFLNVASREWHGVEGSEYLRGAVWHWATWRERQATSFNPATGETKPAVWTHDHCHFCYEAAFSERYPNDLREGWTTSGPRVCPPEEWRPNYHWVCPACFTRYREQFGWTTEGSPPT